MKKNCIVEHTVPKQATLRVLAFKENTVMIPQSPTASSAIKEAEAQRNKKRKMRNEGQKQR